MEDFRYHALDAEGVRFSDIIKARSVADAAARLNAAEVNLIAVELASGAPPLQPNRVRARHEPVDQRPPVAPRDIKVRLRDQAAGLVLLFIGSIFAVAGGFTLSAGLAVASAGNAEPATVLLLLAAAFLPVGLGMIGFVVRWRRKRSRTYRDGDVAMATIEKVGHNRAVRVNNRNPLQLVWTFELGGTEYRGRRSTFDHRVNTFVTGDKMWVVFRAADPKNSVEWPPLR